MMTKVMIIATILQLNPLRVDNYSGSLDDIQFEVNSDQLDEKQVEELKKIIKTINRFLEEGPENNFTLWINGNADPSEKHPSRLSSKRAIMVRERLTKLGLSNGTLITHGFGAKRPIANSSTDAGKRKNARVDFKIAFD